MSYAPEWLKTVFRTQLPEFELWRDHILTMRLNCLFFLGLSVFLCYARPVMVPGSGLRGEDLDRLLQQLCERHSPHLWFSRAFTGIIIRLINTWVRVDSLALS